MANYTISIEEILQEHMGENQTINNLDDILAVAKQHIFDGAPEQAMTAILEQYKDPFMLGFCMHFLFEEIGMETIPAFKLALASTILDNTDFINSTYEILENQVWSEYEIRKIENATTDKGTIQTDNDTTEGGSVTDERIAENSTTTNRNATAEDDGTITDEGELTDGGTITDEGGTTYKGKTKNNNNRYYTAEDEMGNPTTPKITQHSVESDGQGTPAYSESVQTGSYGVQQGQTGSIKDTSTDTGSEILTERDGTGDKAYTKRTPSGTRTQTVTHTGGMLHGYLDHATDSTHSLSLTPQSGINSSDLMTVNRQAGQPATVPASVAQPNQTATTKYLTQADHVANNDYLHSNWDIPYDSVNGDKQATVESFDQYEDIQETHYNRETEREFDNREHETTRSFQNYQQNQTTTYNNLTNKTTQHYNRDNLSETIYEDNFTEHAEGTTEYENRTDERENVRTLDTTRNSTTTKTLDTTRTNNTTRTLDTIRTEHDNTLITGNEEATTTHTYDKNGTNDTLETRNLKGTSDTDEKTYRFNYEMFSKAEPYLAKIWRLFDDCFMSLLFTLY